MGQLITNIERNKIFQDVLIKHLEKENNKSLNRGEKGKKKGDIVKNERKNN